MHPLVDRYLNIFPRREWSEAIERTLLYGIRCLENERLLSMIDIDLLRDLTIEENSEEEAEREQMELLLENEEESHRKKKSVTKKVIDKVKVSGHKVKDGGNFKLTIFDDDRRRITETRGGWMKRRRTKMSSLTTLGRSVVRSCSNSSRNQIR